MHTTAGTQIERIQDGLMENPKTVASGAERLRRALEEYSLPIQIRRFPRSTRTAEDAAAAIGCDVGQIAKSLIFRGADSDRPILVVASGAHRVDVERVAAAIGEHPGKANADYVRQRTGYAIGGVAPVGHLEPPRTVIDRALLDYASIWAAAGTPDSVFEVTPDVLVRITGGEVMELAAAE